MDKTRLKPHEVGTTFLVKGIPGVSRLHAEKQLSKNQVKVAIGWLARKGVPTQPLEHWYFNVYQEDYRKSNRKAPRAGERRVYNTFAQNDAPTPYLKIPVNVLGVGVGASVSVFFEQGRIIISKN